ncbi:hypothetical protein NC661_04585 [Aquibacillus koreensis]|uniref:Uncharacterized protein n=1 Tax=Aquibacillus koreensis TaxID=279446 RepID=A0A9X3WLY9_9BACI|nr:hypothetical protein [Aquibacillus koreensis]MCT2534749.1 hypothetical protein [Aquibacillus koreensis]MDC3419641.1 hypothetical protein [Aquibacillus koreensis]
MMTTKNKNMKLANMSQEEKIELRVTGISDADLPDIISGQVTKLNELDKSVKEAMMKAEKAVESADSAKDKSTGLFKKKAAIEELQDAGVDLAEAVLSGAEAQKISFDFQRKLAEISKYLFGLGVSNIASNRSVLRELEMKLNGASKQKLSALAKQELVTVVKQLKDQEDMLMKQEKIVAVVKSHDERLVEHSEKSATMEKVIAAQSEVDKKHEEELKRQSETDRQLEKLIRAQEEVDKGLAERVLAQEETDKRLEKLIHAQGEVDKNLAEQVAAQHETDQRLEKLIHAQGEADKHLAEQVAAQHETDQRLEKLIQAQGEVDKNLAEQVAAQHETDQRLEQLIRSLEEVDKHLVEQVATQEVTDDRLEALIQEQGAKIELLENEVNELKDRLDTRASKSLGIVAMGIGVVSLIVGVIGLVM